MLLYIFAFQNHISFHTQRERFSFLPYVLSKLQKCLCYEWIFYVMPKLDLFLSNIFVQINKWLPAVLLTISSFFLFLIHYRSLPDQEQLSLSEADVYLLHLKSKMRSSAALKW